MRYLIAETVALKPHLETAGELALHLQAQGHEVQFAWLGEGLPWSDWRLPRGAHFLGCSLARRRKRFEHILARAGISLVTAQALSGTVMKKIIAWAEDFTGDAEALKRYGYDNAILGMGAASSLISLHGDSAYDPRHNLSEARQCLVSAAIVFERARLLIAQQKPDAVITFNGRFATAKPIVAAAEAAGIKTYRHERGATYDRYELYSDAIHNFSYIRSRIADAWQQADPQEREQLGHDYYRRRRSGDGVGWYSFTDRQKRGHVPPRPADKRRVVYFSSSDDEYAAVSDVFTPGPWPSQLAAVEALILAAATHPDIELILRIHPHLMKKSAAERARWAALAERGIRVISPEEEVDSYALADSAQCVVSYGSMMGIEAAYWGTPSILIGPCNYVGSGAVSEASTVEELTSLLRPGHPLPAPVQARCLPFGHYYMSYGTPYRYYRPSSLSEGEFLGDRLGWDPAFIHWLRQQKAIKKIVRALLKRK